MNNDFLNEIENCDIPDLQLILKDQSDLYTPEELELIRETIEKKQNVPRGTFSGDWNFCLWCFVLRGIGLIIASMTGLSVLHLLGLIFGLYIRWNQYQIGKKIVSIETWYSVLSFLYPAVGLVYSIMDALLSFLYPVLGLKFSGMDASLRKRCLKAAFISFMIRFLLMSGGFQF